METPPATAVDAGLGAGTPASHRADAAPPPAAGAVLEGVVQLSPDNFGFTAPLLLPGGPHTLVPGFATAAAAAAGRAAVMASLQCRAADAPPPGEACAAAGQVATPASAAERAAAESPPAKPSLPPSSVAAPSAPAAAPAEAAAGGPSAARLYKGVHQNKGSTSFQCVAMLGDGLQQRCGPFPTAEAAARAYDVQMRLHNRRVVNFPQLPGEVQAVYGEMEHVTLRMHERNPNRVVNPPRRNYGGPRTPKAEAPMPPTMVQPTMPPTMPPMMPLQTMQPTTLPTLSPTMPPMVPPTMQPAMPPPQRASASPPGASPPGGATADERQYKGVRRSSKFRYTACQDQHTTFGSFLSAKEAADAYDACVRQKGGRVVNTPLLPGELQAVYGELDSVTLWRAANAAARAGAQPLRKSRRAAGLAASKPPPDAPRRATPVKRTADESDGGDGDDASGDGAAACADDAPEPECKRLCAAAAEPAPLPPAAPLPLAHAAPPAPSVPSALAVGGGGGGHDVASFLRGISPPLADIEAVAARAAASGLQMRHLREALLLHGPQQGWHNPAEDRATNMHFLADILNITSAADKFAVLMALQRTAA